MSITLRAGRGEDAPLLAELVNYAGEGLPLYLWDQMAQPGETAWDVGRRRAAREEGSFSYRNAVIAELHGQPVGCVIGYDIPDAPEPVPAGMPPMFRPLQELENTAPGTWYVNVLAVVPETRRRGVGKSLLGHAEDEARRRGRAGLSIIVSDTNDSARRLYELAGYRETAQRPMVKDNWTNEGSAWILLTRPFS
jgi:ribosomal protein S18 acetylase RimI-like enzyme